MLRPSPTISRLHLVRTHPLVFSFLNALVPNQAVLPRHFRIIRALQRPLALHPPKRFCYSGKVSFSSPSFSLGMAQGRRPAILWFNFKLQAPPAPRPQSLGKIYVDFHIPGCLLEPVRRQVRRRLLHSVIHLIIPRQAANWGVMEHLEAIILLGPKVFLQSLTFYAPDNRSVVHQLESTILKSTALRAVHPHNWSQLTVITAMESAAHRAKFEFQGNELEMNTPGESKFDHIGHDVNFNAVPVES
ncbi:hypothetical protein C8F04DRAFT_1183968 [Mycena alexandri]|uniref:Uncharacterized protein n=1 Tax=Mycena alexandri TaxID=1745969 RepID=A0AAD6SVL6_9AGAR|nr:hypothetical protein C8F04DRAFT_1183968 [Mycena alexandri]